jgi:lipoate-protein ligase A
VRLLKTPPADPAYNLALDEALLRTGTPTLRLYGWNPPGYSLGFFQERARHEPPPGFTVVRRPTGGGAIAHAGELTISWVGARRRVGEAYARMNAVVTRALADRFGLTAKPGRAAPEAAPEGLCFDTHTCYDLLVGGGKIFGSAQRRAGERFLLHGTFVLEPNPWCGGAVSLEELLGRAVSRQEAEDAIVAAWGEPLTEGDPSDAERRGAGRLLTERYGNPAWTNRR